MKILFFCTIQVGLKNFFILLYAFDEQTEATMVSSSLYTSVNETLSCFMFAQTFYQWLNWVAQVASRCLCAHLLTSLFEDFFLEVKPV